MALITYTMLCKLHPYFQNIFFTLLSALSDNSSVPLPQPLVIPQVFSVCVVLPVLSVCLHAQSYPTLCNPMESSRLVCPWDFPDKNTGVGCHFLPHMIFLTQGLSPHLLSPVLAGRFFIPKPLGKPSYKWNCKIFVFLCLHYFA